MGRLSEFFRSLFTPRTDLAVPRETCSGCEAMRDHIVDLRLRNEDLREERTYLRNALFKVVRIPLTEEEQKQPRVHHEPVKTGPGKTWGRIQRELESKHRRKPEDQTEAYWMKKNAELEKQAGFIPSDNEDASMDVQPADFADAS